jgi:hypothetical protein
MKCNYGCGKDALYRFKNGKWCCSKNYLSCPSSRTRQKNVVIAKRIKTKEKCSYNCGRDARYIFEVSGKFCCSRYLQSCPSIKKKNSKTNSIKQSGKNNGMYGKKHTKEAIRKNRESNKKLWNDPKSFFNSAEWRRRVSKAANIRPNNPEKVIHKILSDIFPGKFEYTGDFSFWIGRKNPDFVNKENKLVIEYFGEYYHSKEEETPRINYFKKFGYKTLIIWESELKTDYIANRIKKFVERSIK